MSYNKYVTSNGVILASGKLTCTTYPDGIVVRYINKVGLGDA